MNTSFAPPIQTGNLDLPRPSWDQYFMNIADVVATRSPYRKTMVGCVIVSTDNRIISTGYNGYFAGAPHVAVIQDGHEKATVHAEANAVCYAQGEGTDCTAYITHYPCLDCFKLLVSFGITRIVYKNDKNNNELIPVLADNYVEIFKL